jgi:hypothetical protein
MIKWYERGMHGFWLYFESLHLYIYSSVMQFFCSTTLLKNLSFRIEQEAEEIKKAVIGVEDGLEKMM